MSGALLGAASCLRCGSVRRDGQSCGQCGTVWAAAAEAGVLHGGAGPLSGVVRAAIGRRYLAQLVDVLVLVGMVALVVGLTPGRGSFAARWVVAIAVVLAVLLVQGCWLLTRGRSLGRLLLSLRTVDDLSGTPVRLGRLLRQLGRPGLFRRFLTADLRRGRDPLEPGLAPALLGANHGPESPRVLAAVGAGGGSGSPTSSNGASPFAATAAVGPGTQPRTSVDIVLESGERYEIDRPLLIGRSPVDPDGRGERALLSWPDLSRRVAKTHVLLEWSGTMLWVTDLHSAAGTAITGADGTRLPLRPGVRAPAGIGSVIACGGRTLKVVPHG